MAAALADRLRAVCALMLAEGAPDPNLAAWCRRMLTEPGAAERTVEAVERGSVGRDGTGNTPPESL
jgi:hypothetical protein